MWEEGEFFVLVRVDFEDIDVLERLFGRARDAWLNFAGGMGAAVGDWLRTSALVIDFG